MLLGMMVVGTSASYTDVSSKDNKEAIEVAQAAGIMTGDENGNFNPAKSVTRAEMAVVMANMLDLQVNDFKAAKLPFTDVPAWAAPYVAACYADGITAGTSATTYGSNNTVTAAQAALMMMKALGYFQTSADFGEDWQLATVKQASKIDLYNGIDASATSAMTRNEIAQLVLNTLEATMVETESTGSNITIGDITISNGAAKYEDRTTTKYDYTRSNGKYAEGSDKTLQLCEKLYGTDLLKSSDNDDLGRPGTKWVYDGDKVGVYGDEADYVLVLEKAYKAEDFTDDEKVLAELQDLTDNDDLDFKYNADKKQITELFINGSNESGNGAAAVATYGTVVELFCDGDVIETVVALDYDLAKISDVSTSLTKAQKEDGATCKIKVDGTWYTNDKVADFDEDTYVEDAYILYVVNAKGEIIASELAETVEGKVTSKKSGDVKIDGEWYGVAEETVKVGDEGTFYLNKAGQIANADTESAKSDNYGYIYAVDSEKKANSDGIKSDVVTVYMVLADGTKASYIVEEDSVAKLGTISEDYAGKLVAYSVNSDDELVVETGKNTVATQAKTGSVDKNDAKIANGLNTSSTTEFIFIDKGTSKVKVTTNTGYKNVDINEAPIWTVADGSDVLYAFVIAKETGVKSDAKLAVVLDAEAAEEENEDGDIVYTYAVVVDGEETELTFENEQKFTKGVVYAYEMDGDYAVLDKDTTIYKKNVKAANDDYMIVTEKDAEGQDIQVQYNLGDETLYTVTRDYDGTDFDVTVSEGGKIETGNWVYYTLDGDNLDLVFVINDIK